MTTPPDSGPSAQGAKFPYLLAAMGLTTFSLLACVVLLPVYSSLLAGLLVTEGIADHNAGNDRRAVMVLTQAIALAPKNADARTERGSAYFRLSRYENALRDFDRAVQLQPGNERALFNRGDAYGQLGKYREALEDFDQAIEINPQDERAFNDRATVYLKQGAYEKALADVDQAIDLNPQFAEAYCNRGLAYFHLGQANTALDSYNQALQLDPNFALAYEGRALLALNRGDFDAALADDNTAIRLQPASAEAYHNRGLVYLQKNDIADALTDFNQAIQLDPRYAVAYISRGRIFGSQGDFDHAMADFNQAIGLNTQDASAYSNRGFVYFGQRRYDEAIGDLTQALQLDPNLASAYFIRGLAYTRRGKSDLALADFTHAIQIDPKAASYYTSRGEIYGGKSDNTHALADFNQALALNPKDGATHVDLALVDAKTGDYEKAIAECEQAIKLTGNPGGAYNNLAWILATCPQAKYRDGKRALTAATMACNLTSWKDPVTLDTLAAACAESGDFPAAVQWEQAAIDAPGLSDSDLPAPGNASRSITPTKPTRKPPSKPPSRLPTKMKSYLWLVLGVFAGTASCLLADAPPVPHADAFSNEGLIKADVSSLKDTELVAHPDAPIPPNHNVIWCGTLQLAWNKAIDLVGEKLQFVNQPPVVDLLNQENFTGRDLDLASYVALADFERNHVEAEIRAALEKTFHGAASPELIPPIPPNPGPDDFVAYAYLFKNLAFPIPFEENRDTVFTDPAKGSSVVPVKGFGFPKNLDKPSPDIFQQVAIFDYQSKDDFVLKLKTKVAGDELILAKIEPGATLAATIDTVLKRMATGKREVAGENDVLSIPELNYDLRGHFPELENLLLQAGPNARVKNLVTSRVMQLVRFQLNKEGAMLKSEAILAFTAMGIPREVDHHLMIFDKPFLILMKRADSPQPYFAMWIGNASLLIPAK